MDSQEVLKKTQELVNFLLRYLVAGGSAILAFGLTQQHPFSFLQVGTELSPVLLLFFVSVIGPAVYSIHKAALHQVILIPIFLGLRCWHRLDIRWWELDRTLTRQLEKWRKPPPHEWMSTYEAWAAQIHFLYCSAFGIIFALVLVYFFNPSPNYIKPLRWIALFLFVAAFVSDWRLTNLQIKQTIEAGGLQQQKLPAV
jgi:hypothetical protein